LEGDCAFEGTSPAGNSDRQVEIGPGARKWIALAGPPLDLIIPLSFGSGVLGTASMEKDDWASMTTAELWRLYDEVTTVLGRRMTAEKAKLEERLRRIEGPAAAAQNEERSRRPYPPVLPKYQNPKNPSETWSGRGKQPRWLKAQLRAGKKLHDLLIDRPSAQRRRRTG
jgi:DNA-binding protein H-NS